MERTSASVQSLDRRTEVRNKTCDRRTEVRNKTYDRRIERSSPWMTSASVIIHKSLLSQQRKMIDSFYITQTYSLLTGLNQGLGTQSFAKSSRSEIAIHQNDLQMFILG
jgi:hypothetical protein